LVSGFDLPFYLTIGFCILYGLLWGSTVGYPSDSLASCLEPSLYLYNDFGDIQYLHDLDTSSKRSRSFIVVPIDFSYTTFLWWYDDM